jgi:hypothetical protein
MSLNFFKKLEDLPKKTAPYDYFGNRISTFMIYVKILCLESIFCLNFIKHFIFKSWKSPNLEALQVFFDLKRKI